VTQDKASIDEFLWFSYSHSYGKIIKELIFKIGKADMI
jgi:hypothetical protein